MGFLSKLVKGDWSNPFDNVKSGTKNFFESNWNKGVPILKGMALAGGASYMGIPWKTIGSAALDFYSSERANQQSADSVRAQLQFQERMSNTSYQRAMSDMLAAGLNPMLAYQQGGASTPGGANYRANVPTPGTALQQHATATAGRVLTAAQVRNTEQSTATSAASAKDLDASANLKNVQAVTEGLRQAKTSAETAKTNQEVALARANTANAEKALEKILADISFTHQRIIGEQSTNISKEAQAAQDQWRTKLLVPTAPTVDKLQDRIQDILESWFPTTPSSGKEASTRSKRDNKTSSGYIPPNLLSRPQSLQSPYMGE